MPIAPSDIRKVSIIIPCYNEVANISEVIDRVSEVDVGLEKEIIIVDDGSVDGTMQLLEEMKEQHDDSSVLKVHFSVRHRRRDHHPGRRPRVRSG